MVRNLIKQALMNYAWPLARFLLSRRSGISLSKASSIWISSGNTVIDIGANDGRTAFVFSCCVGRNGSVYAIEPNPALCKNIRQSRYKNIAVHKIAISSSIGETDFFIDTQASAVASTLNRAHVAREMERHGAVFARTRIKTVTLDRFCDENHIVPDFIKIDVEGAEEDVIRGGLEVLRKHHPIVWFECWCGQENGVPINAQLSHLALLKTLGYRLFVATVFNKNGQWILQEAPENPRQLLPLTDEVVCGPTVGIDVAAIPNGRLVPKF